METVNEALTLLKRQAELENAIKQPGDIRRMVYQKYAEYWNGKIKEMQ